MARSRRTSQAAFSMFAFQDIITSVTGICILLTLVLVLHWINTPAKATAPQEDRSVEASEIDRELAAARVELEALNQQLAELTRVSSEAARTPPENMNREASRLKDRVQELTADRNALIARHAKAEELAGDLRTTLLKTRESREATENSKESQEFRGKVEQLRKDNALIYAAETRATRLAWIVDITEGRLDARRIDGIGQRVEFSEGDADMLLDRFRAWTEERDARREYFMLLVRPSGVEIYQKLVPSLMASGFKYGYDLIAEDAQIRVQPAQGATP
jgi:hypothetical protein